MAPPSTGEAPGYNPGIWSDHCHTLQHAQDGLIAHLLYEGVTTRFTIGGRHANHPE